MRSNEPVASDKSNVSNVSNAPESIVVNASSIFEGWQWAIMDPSLHRDDEFNFRR